MDDGRVTADGADGVPAAPDTWQGVSREEHENSYIRQWGVYTAFDVGDDAPSPTWVGCHGACAFVDADGWLRTYGPGQRGSVAREIQGLLHRCRPLALFATSVNVAALVPFTVDGVASNRLIVWGEPVSFAGSLHRLGGIRHVYAGSQSFVLLYDKPVDDRWLDVIGGPASNAVPVSIQLALLADPPASIRVTETAFAVLTASGKVFSWGNATQGGTIPGSTAALLARMNVQKIVASRAAFCAVSDAGELVAWGDASAGGTLPTQVVDTIVNDDGALSVVASRSAFACITRGRRKAVAWGDSYNGGSISGNAATQASAGDVAICKASVSAFCIVTSDGRIAAWGSSSGGGSLPAPPGTVGIASAADDGDAETPETTSALRTLLSAEPTDDASQTWVGATRASTDGRVTVHSTESGFLLVATAADGRITLLQAWGTNTQPSDTVRQVLLASRPVKIVTSNRGCLAVVRQGDVDGCVLVWGDATATGILTSASVDFLDSPVDEVHPIGWVSSSSSSTSTSCGFFCRGKDGAAAIWGTTTPTIVRPISTP